MADETEKVNSRRDRRIKEWLAVRKEEGRRIDPRTAKVSWWYAQTFDPYGVDRDLPEELDSIGREYFACAPDSDIWVWFGDLPKKTEKVLWDKHHKVLAFPAGILPKRRLVGRTKRKSKKLVTKD